MGLPTEPLTLSPEKIHDLNQKLSTFRHNVNNHLSLIIAGVEVMRRKPELAQRMADTMSQQPERIMAEIKLLADELDRALGITRE